MTTRKRNGGAHLDEVNKLIIEQLQQDGRRSYAAIGKEVGLSEAAVRQRVQRLVDSGVMQVVAVTDPLELGFARQAMIGVRTSGPIEGIAAPPVLLELLDDQLVDLVEVSAPVALASGHVAQSTCLPWPDATKSVVCNEQFP